MTDFPNPSSGAHFHLDGPTQRPPSREAISRAARLPEAEALAPLLSAARLGPTQATAADALARQLVTQLREGATPSGRVGRVQNLMQEYALSSDEGVALMCLAEALLRIPDAATRDALIRDKIGQGGWEQHLGRSPSLFVNAATWGLLLTGRLVATHSEGQLQTSLRRLVGRSGEPLIRKGVDLAMRMLGEQFVTGETMAEALERAQPQEAEGFRYSYDMLGEAALTAADADRYLHAYTDAIHAIGRAARGQGVISGPGISIKLSALHPRYTRTQHARVMDELLPRLLELAQLAKHYEIGLNIDAEEAERLDLSLDLLEGLCAAPTLAGWHGLGFVVQAYLKRCPFVIDHLIELARRNGRRLMVRLVKGAYWDSEIKRAQVDGQSDYPVYTRKHHSDVSYLACARKLLDAPDAVYPQFATHNAQTLAAVVQLAGPTFAPGQYEFQCLHGMGEPLYRQVVGAAGIGRPCRIYAPVGTHETLLAYLVRRLLENGANSSFVNRMADTAVSLDDLVQDPVARCDAEAMASERAPGQPHPAIALPAALYGAGRRNSLGPDLSHEPSLWSLSQSLQAAARLPVTVAPMLAGEVRGAEVLDLPNPADHGDRVGQVQMSHADDVDVAIAQAEAAALAWGELAPAERAAMLERAADLLQADMARCLSLLVREAGKTWGHAVAEWREAIDFLRYYAAQVRRDFAPHSHLPLGPVVCISPWNFPLAIFLGQVSAALAAGNPVLAKPAEQTPAIAALAVQTLWDAGVPRAAVQLLPGRGADVGARLVADARVQGVMFTGSTQTARQLQAALAHRLNRHGQAVPLIAETGGQNAMIVDSSALLEQVVSDAVASAFEAAGQRCSALRVLCVQDDVADRLIELLLGAMAQCTLGAPAQASVDIGPVIDARARTGIEAHIGAMQALGLPVHRVARTAQADVPVGTYVRPTLIEIDHLQRLEREVFGPVLHVLRYRREALDDVLRDIDATGYALTLGVHSRIDETIARVVAGSRAGNVYVNRNMVGAVVGVQPFGGEGLSGTGPKAGGPLYLLRLLSRCPTDAALRSVQATGASALPQSSPALQALHNWALQTQRLALAHACARLAACNPVGLQAVLPGPTGERNVYQVQARHHVACLTGSQPGANDDRLLQLAAVLAVGAQACWPVDAQALRACVPTLVQAQIVLGEPLGTHQGLDAVLFHGSPAEGLSVAQALAARPGALVSWTRCPPGSADIALERLVSERSVSTNTAAAGGNASLMTLV